MVPMKKLLFLIFMVAGISANAQCGYQRVGVGTGVSPLDTVSLPPNQSVCQVCHDGGKFSWELDSAFSGMIFLNSDMQIPVSVRITKNCSEVLFDTCVVLPPMGMAGICYYKEFIAVSDCQLHVFGAYGQVVALDVKSWPVSGEPVSNVIFDMDTCGTATSIEMPMSQGPGESYMVTLSGVHVSGENIPAGVYIEIFPDKRRLVRVLR